MMGNSPAIYVLAGPNGVGKTTVNPYFIPRGVPYINADDIARQLRERLDDINVQELANAQSLERMNAFIAKREDFAIETNLADKETWLFLIGVQGLGYTLHLNFFGVSDVDICINRVYNRVLQGGHFVRPDIVKMRYERVMKRTNWVKILSRRATNSAILFYPRFSIKGLLLNLFCGQQRLLPTVCSYKKLAISETKTVCQH